MPLKYAVQVICKKICANQTVLCLKARMTTNGTLNIHAHLRVWKVTSVVFFTQYKDTKELIQKQCQGILHTVSCACGTEGGN